MPEITQSLVQNDAQLFWQAVNTEDLLSLNMLLEKPFPPIEAIQDDVTLLWQAAKHGELEIVETLIKHGANVNFNKHNNESVLWVAIKEGHSKIVELLLQNGASVNHASPLHIAVEKSQLKIIKKLISKGADVNYAHEETGETPLHIAAGLGKIEIIDELIKANADIHCTDKKGMTPLHVACLKDHVKIVEKLLEVRANVNAETVLGKTPLSYVNADSPITKILLKHGASFDLSQIKINTKFLKYLDFYRTLHPKKYEKHELEEIKTMLRGGLCYGYSKLYSMMKDAGLQNQLQKQLESIITWDESIESLKNASMLEYTFESLLFNTLALHLLQPLSSEKLNVTNVDLTLANLNHCYEQIFNFGFVFKEDELNNLFQQLLHPGITLDIGIGLNTISQGMHEISITEVAQDEHHIVDCNTSITRPIKTDSLDGLIGLLKEMLNIESGPIGLTIKMRRLSPTAEEKAKYSQIKNNLADAVLSKRKLANEIDLCDTFNLTALFYALLTADTETAQKLISYHAFPGTGKEYLSPVCIAARLRRNDLVKKLLKNGYDVNSKSRDDSTLLHLSACLNLVELVPLLLKNKANVNCQTEEGATPLFLACQNGFYDIAKKLITEKADLNLSVFNFDYFGRKRNCFSPLMSAIFKGHVEIVKLLIEQGVNVNQSGITLMPLFGSPTVMSPLGLAIKMKSLEMVKLLVTAGANLALVNNQSQSALAFAIAKKQTDIVEYLNSLNAKKECSPPAKTWTDGNGATFFKEAPIEKTKASANSLESSSNVVNLS